MNVSVRKASLSELDLLMEWRMRVLAEVFSDSERPDLESIRKNNERYYKEHLGDDTHTACFAADARLIDTRAGIILRLPVCSLLQINCGVTIHSPKTAKSDGIRPCKSPPAMGRIPCILYFFRPQSRSKCAIRL